MDIVDKLYGQPFDVDQMLIGGVNFHIGMLKTLDYFKHALKYQHGEITLTLLEPSAIIFKKWLYRQPIRFCDDIKEYLADTNSLEDVSIIDISQELRELSKMLDIRLYVDHVKNPLFVYVLESKNSDLQFEYFKAFHIHDKRFTLIPQQVASLDKRSYAYAACLYGGITCEKNMRQAFDIFKHNWEEKKCSDSLYSYAVCLRRGIICEKDKKKAFELCEYNWKENKDCDSLNMYAHCLSHGEGCEKDKKKAFELYKLNWEENKHSGGLHKYAHCLFNGHGCDENKKKAFELYKYNWEENKHSNSLHSYAYLLEQQGNFDKAIELYKLNWEENKDSDSLYFYALCFRDGIACEKDDTKAFELFKFNWEENEHKESLQCYIKYLMYGIGCEKDEKKAFELMDLVKRSD